MFTKEVRICLVVSEKGSKDQIWYTMPTISLTVEKNEEIQEFFKNLPDISTAVSWIDSAFLMAIPSSSSHKTLDLLKSLYTGEEHFKQAIKEEMVRMSGKEIDKILVIDLETNTHMINFENEQPYVLTEKDKEAVDAMNAAINSMIMGKK